LGTILKAASEEYSTLVVSVVRIMKFLKACNLQDNFSESQGKSDEPDLNHT